MNRRPGHTTVTVETGYCSFCGRPRNLRSEAHQLGTLVRTIVTCETCHRTLSSTIGVATEEPARAEEPAAPLPAPTATTSSRGGDVEARKPAAKKAAAKKVAAAKKPVAATKPAAKTAKTPAKKAAPKKK